MQVKILVAGKYNDQDHLSQNMEAGDVLTTLEWYGRSIIESGYAAEEIDPDALVEEAGLEDGQDTISVSIEDVDHLVELTDLPRKGTPKVSIDEEGEEVDFSEIVPGLSRSMAHVLIEGGFYNKKLLANATEDDILYLPGVGRGTWKKILSWQKSLEPSE